MIPTKRQLLFILAAMCAIHIAAAFPIPSEEFEEGRPQDGLPGVLIPEAAVPEFKEIRPDDGLTGVLVQESQHNDNDKEVLYGEAAVPEFEEGRPQDGLPGVLIPEGEHNDNDKEVLYGEAFEGDMLMA